MENLQEAEELGKLFFTRKEVMIILTHDVQTLQQAILKGQLQEEAEVRKVIIQQAKSGSGEAQKLVLQFISRIRSENVS